MLFFFLACSPDPTPTPDHDVVVTPLEDDTGEQTTTPKDTTVDTVAGYEDPSTLVFDDPDIHDYRLSISAEGLESLKNRPKQYVEATFSDGMYDLTVGVRRKGNTTNMDMTSKPSLIVKFNWADSDQQYYDIPSVYLHNMTWDASMMHEHLAYWTFRQADIPASRTAYVHLDINDVDYGLYLLVEKQNGLYLDQWFEDTSGSVYESGSFNYPCDLQYNCECFEVDREGDGDSFEDLVEFCNAVKNAGSGFLDVVNQHMDFPAFLHGQAMEMIVSHYDNYGWNTNNFRLYHEPTLDEWHWTPWSTDLGWGWYPWMSSPSCGTYGVTPSEYGSGYLIQRCWEDPECTSQLHQALLNQADVFEKMNARGELEETYERIVKLAHVDPRSRYSAEQFESEIACMRDYIASRPETIRVWVDQQQ